MLGLLILKMYYDFCKRSNEFETKLAAENIKTAKSEYDFQYGLSFSKIFIAGDLNGDKLDDVVLQLYTCDIESCHNTTGANDMAVFINKGITYELAATKSLGMTVDDISSVYDSEKMMIQVDTSDYGDSDPTCCPSIKKSQKYKLSGKELVLVS